MSIDRLVSQMMNGSQPEQQQAAVIAAPLNDCQMVCFMAALLPPAVGTARERVAEAIDIAAEAVVAFNQRDAFNTAIKLKAAAQE